MRVGRSGRPRLNDAKASPLPAQLRSIRIANGVSVSDLADRLGYDRFSIGRWERGEMVPSLLKFVDWAAALGYEVKLRPGAELALAETIPFPSKQKMMGQR